MSTFLFDQIVYGPVHSRRLGASLGINILPADGKRCTFNCIYCECGLNEERKTNTSMPRRQDIRQALERKLTEMQASGNTPDVITFSGNGEPTMHPEFSGIIGDTLELRQAWAPNTRIAVLSNATLLHKPDVFDALCRVDDNIMKLDSALDFRMLQIDAPAIQPFTCQQVIEQLIRFEGRLVVQTIFLRGERNGVIIDNTSDEEITAWIEALKQIKPRQVMIYTINRETPVKGLQKLTPEQLEAIARRVREAGFEVSVSV